MTETYALRPAQPSDLEQIFKLLPELADFQLPDHRHAEDLWQGDAELLNTIMTGSHANAFVHVAANTRDDVHGFIIVSMREELLSHAPSAHLETIVVHPGARGTGLGKMLLAHCEAEVRKRGATSLTLHVFRNNERALALYEKSGFDAELIRAIKWLT